MGRTVQSHWNMQLRRELFLQDCEIERVISKFENECLQNLTDLMQNRYHTPRD